MGITTISAKISNVDNPQKQVGEKFMIDTGAAYTVLPYTRNKNDTSAIANRQISVLICPFGVGDVPY